VLSSVGGIHNNVSVAGFQRVLGPNGECSPQFWINGANGEKYETLVHTWDNHRQLVLLPDDGSAVAADDRNANGDRNIGVRAKELVNAYLEFTRALVTVSEHLGLVASQEDIGQFDSQKVKYRGWWSHPEFKSLGHVALETMPFADLLDRSKDIFNLLQRLQKSPLLQMAVNLGLKKDEVKGFQSLKLVGTICQLAQLAVDSGFDLIQDKASIAAQWDAKVELEPLCSLSLAFSSPANLDPIRASSSLS